MSVASLIKLVEIIGIIVGSVLLAYWLVVVVVSLFKLGASARVSSFVALSLPLAAFACSLVFGRVPRANRLVLGLTLGWMVTWLTLMLTTRELAVDQMAQYNPGLHPYYDHGSTWAVGGFPIAAVQFGNGFSFPDHIPWSKGLAIHLLNLLINSAACCFVALRVPRRVLRLTAVSVAVAGVLLLAPTCRWYVAYVD